jgi:hypothetical protein
MVMPTAMVACPWCKIGPLDSGNNKGFPDSSKIKKGQKMEPRFYEFG